MIALAPPRRHRNAVGRRASRARIAARADLQRAAAEAVQVMPADEVREYVDRVLAEIEADR